MRKITFAAALAAATALSAPAFAAGSGDAAKAGGTATQTQAQSGGSSSMSTDTGSAGASASMQSQGGQAAGMSGENMDQDEIRDLQQALKDAGRDVEVDGVWGDSTAQALRDFQEEEGITASGELDDETLTALGLDLGTGVQDGATQQAETPSGTTGTTPGAGTAGSTDEPMPQSKPDDASGGTSTGGTTTGGGSTGGASGSAN